MYCNDLFDLERFFSVNHSWIEFVYFLFGEHFFEIVNADYSVKAFERNLICWHHIC